MRLNTPEEKGWAAAEALTQYLHDLGLSNALHWPSDNLNGTPEDRSWANLPADAVIIQVGIRTSRQIREDLKDRRRKLEEEEIVPPGSRRPD
jgi:hypothetical protein